MTVSRPCYFGNLLLGVVGVDVNLAYILEDVTYYQDSLASYTFLIDNKGESRRERESSPAASEGQKGNSSAFLAAKRVPIPAGADITVQESAKSFPTCAWLQLQLLQLHN